MSDDKVPFMGIQIQYDEETNHFIMSFIDDDSLSFRVRMSPENFQSLSNDMIKITKSYNLWQSEEYKRLNSKVEINEST